MKKYRISLHKCHNMLLYCQIFKRIFLSFIFFGLDDFCITTTNWLLASLQNSFTEMLMITGFMESVVMFFKVMLLKTEDCWQSMDITSLRMCITQTKTYHLRILYVSLFRSSFTPNIL